jgi:hypothetical protein
VRRLRLLRRWVSLLLGTLLLISFMQVTLRLGFGSFMQVTLLHAEHVV